MAYFLNADGLTDQALLTIKEGLGKGSQAEVEAYMEILGARSRRLMILFAPSKMTDNEKIRPALSLERVSDMTDAEIIEGYNALEALEKAEFQLAVKKINGPLGQRINQVLAASATKAAEPQVAKKLEDPVINLIVAVNKPANPLNDQQTLEYIHRAGKLGAFFKSAAEVEDLMGEDQKILCMYSKQRIPVSEARVLQLCFICRKQEAVRLAEKMPYWKGRQVRPYNISETLAFLRSQQTTAEARQRREEEQARAKADFPNKIQQRFNAATSFIHVASLIRELRQSEAEGEDGEVPDWKWHIISHCKLEREQEIRDILWQNFKKASDGPALEKFISQLRQEFHDLPEDAHYSVPEAFQRQIQEAREYLVHLTGHNVSGSSASAKVIPLAKRGHDSDEEFSRARQFLKGRNLYKERMTREETLDLFKRERGTGKKQNKKDNGH